MNTPILMQSEEKEAPWNEEVVKTVEVDISISMSCHTKIEIPESADETDSQVLEQAVRDQIYTPIDLIDDNHLGKDWIVDEFCVL